MVSQCTAARFTSSARNPSLRSQGVTSRSGFMAASFAAAEALRFSSSAAALASAACARARAAVSRANSRLRFMKSRPNSHSAVY